MERCRTDNGTALKRIHKNAGDSYAYLQFTDDKVYHVAPVTEADMFHLAQPDTMPGCWFNKDLKKRKRFYFRRLDHWPVTALLPGISIDFFPRPTPRQVTNDP